MLTPINAERYWVKSKGLMIPFFAILLLFTELLLIKNMMEKGAELSGYLFIQFISSIPAASQAGGTAVWRTAEYIIMSHELRIMIRWLEAANIFYSIELIN